MALLILLGGCGLQRSATVRAPASITPHSPSDSVSTFASQAALHEEARIVLPDGQPATLRMVRRYFAASGRECSEVSVSNAAGQRSQLLCQGEQGSWLTARPLLRGG